MTTTSTTNVADRIARLIEALDIPESYYEKSIKRAESLCDWLLRPASKVRNINPAVYPQGSFRLGTIIRPILRADEYDLDLVCQMMVVTKAQLTQEQLKQMLGEELKGYVEAHGIKEPLSESKRCWRIDYAGYQVLLTR